MADDDIVVTAKDGAEISFPKDTPHADILKQMQQYEMQHRPSRGQEARYGITDIPFEIGREYQSAYQPIKQFGEWARGAGAETVPSPLSDPRGFISRVPEIGRGIGRGVEALGSAMYMGSLLPPITGALKSLYGHEAEAILQTPGGYEQTKQDVDKAMLAMKPGPRPAVAMPERPHFGEFRVPTPQGEVPQIVGTAGKEHIGAYQDQTKDLLEAAKGDVSKRLDYLSQFHEGQRVATTPSEAGEIIQKGVQRKAAAAQQAATAAYENAKLFPGEISSTAFEDMGGNIKNDLTNPTKRGQQPVIINNDAGDMPVATRMIGHIDDSVSRLKIQNLADPQAPPKPVTPGSESTPGLYWPPGTKPKPPQQIVGVSLKGVDQMRKTLVSMNADAQAARHVRPADARATQAILDAFDQRVHQAVNSGLFRGDPRAVQAWNNARKMWAKYRGTYSGGRRNTPVGNIVEQIIGNKTDAMATGHDVANFAYGSNDTAIARGTNVGVLKRLKGIFGEHSHEWAATRQGLFEKLVTPTQGEWNKPRKVAERIERFLDGDGREMANVVYTPEQRDMLRRFAQLHRQVEITRGGPDEGFAKALTDKISHYIGLIIGGGLAHGGLHGVARIVPVVAAGRMASVLQGAQEAKTIAEKLPLVTQRIADWQRATKLAQTYNKARFKVQAMAAQAAVGRAISELGIPGEAPPDSEEEAAPQYGGPQQ